MRIGIDHSPIASADKASHKIRGTGFYTKHLISALIQYHPENEYVLFSDGEKLNERIDVFHYPYFEPFFLSVPFKKPGKMVITVHDLTPLVFPKEFPVGIKGKVKFFVQKKLIRRADAIITDSASSKRDIEKILGFNPSKVFSIPLAASEVYKKVEVSRKQQEEVCRQYNIPEKFVLYVGDATPNKNLKRLVDAVMALNLPLVMVGGALSKKNIDASHPWNKDIAYVQKTAKENKNIHILGFVSDSELVLLYNMATVFAFPSLYEGFGLPALEAASCGAPIVTAKGGSIAEVIGNAALFIDPMDTESIKKGIEQIFNNRKLQNELSEKGILQASKFTWKKTADETIKVYEEIHK